MYLEDQSDLKGHTNLLRVARDLISKDPLLTNRGTNDYKLVGYNTYTLGIKLELLNLVREVRFLVTKVLTHSRTIFLQVFYQMIHRNNAGKYERINKNTC